jgi:hypothetical protein
VNRAHWDATVGGRAYKLRADGSCALHGIDLAHRVLGNGEAIDREKDHFAPPERVQELRQLVQARQAAEEAIPKIKQEIAHRIAGSEFVFTTGFGPKLRDLLDEAVILKTATDRRDFFEITYTNMLWKLWSLPKPSVGMRVLDTRGFFANDFKSSGKMMEAGLALLHKLHFQVKGLATYPAEIVWFVRKFDGWKCFWHVLFSAMQEHNYEELLRLTANNADAERLLRFEDLQLLERWRADYFAVGAAAHARLGYHG